MNLRCAPRTLDEYVGQEKIKGNLRVYLESSPPAGGTAGPSAALRAPGPWQDHPRLHCGQRDGGADPHHLLAAAIGKAGGISPRCWTNLQEGDILFIDEIHRLSRQVEEVL